MYKVEKQDGYKSWDFPVVYGASNGYDKVGAKRSAASQMIRIDSCGLITVSAVMWSLFIHGQVLAEFVQQVMEGLGHYMYVIALVLLGAL